ncbi:MAG: hypothetical protein M3Q76_09925 [Acidobacteriota bacterium]|nr:hypothetical protein [Acidobacteriota bacterium]
MIEATEGEQMSTPPNDNDKVLGFIAETIEVIRDRMATKDNLTRLEARFEAKLKAEITAVRGDIEQVHIRLDYIERTLNSPRSVGSEDQSASQRGVPAREGQAGSAALARPVIF